VLLALGVAAIVALMILPLPTPLLDVLLATNIAGAVLLLLVAIYLPEAIRFPSFPTVLLLTTLFRLSLNVSSTRLVLLQGDAGAVIRAFGELVVGGDVVVGLVSFLIITVIQFVVIAKGAERVAEVGARFALDAMPGKQMAIDADLRAGSLTSEQARERRAALARESQLYGAMDGAMKFVKGDAIAGIVITVINLVGGLVIGVWRRGLPLGEATDFYSVLTVGDGLVSQIPALLTSTAAAMIVTRVASAEAGENLGRQLVGQLVAEPRALAIAGGLLVMLALVPGLPGAPFLLLGLVAGVAALAAARRNGSHGRGVADLRGGASGPAPAAANVSAGPPTALCLELGAELAAELELGREDNDLLQSLLPAERVGFLYDTGAPWPSVQVVPTGVVTVRGRATARGYRVLIHEIPAEMEEVPAGQGGLGGRLAAAVGRVARRHGRELVGVQETQQLLDELERTHPALVRELVPRPVSLVLLTEVLQRLLDEQVSIRDLRAILQTLASEVAHETDPVVLTELVRASLARQLCWQHAARDGGLAALLLDPLVEDTVRQGVQRSGQSGYLALEPSAARDVVGAISHAVRQGAGNGAAESPVLVTSPYVRRYVRRLIQHELPALAVLSFQEVDPAVELRVVGTVEPV
jgi:type III secretion protein V